MTRLETKRQYRKYRHSPDHGCPRWALKDRHKRSVARAPRGFLDYLATWPNDSFPGTFS